MEHINCARFKMINNDRNVFNRPFEHVVIDGNDVALFVVESETGQAVFWKKYKGYNLDLIGKTYLNGIFSYLNLNKLNRSSQL
jgi:hypothetical protein